MSKPRQLSFARISNEFGDYWKESNRRVHGGVYSQNKRKTARPFSAKKPMHLVVRSSKAKGSLSMWRFKSSIRRIVVRYAEVCDIKIYKYSNNGNHLHLVIKADDRAGFQKFLRTTLGLIAREVTRARKADAKGRYWDALAFTRVADWGRAYDTLRKYVELNILEAAGVVPYQPKKYRLIPAPD